MARARRKAKAPHAQHRMIVVNPRGRGKVRAHIRRLRQGPPSGYMPDGDQPGTDADGGPSGPNSMGW